MKELFFGNPKKHRIDEKHRVSIPAEFRNSLSGNTLYTNYIEKYLIRCYHQNAYERKLKDILTIPENDRERQLFFLAEKSTIDEQGRILLKGPMSELEEVIFAANGNVFDIWDPKEFPYKNHVIE